jgi:hypothetical protein
MMHERQIELIKTIFRKAFDDAERKWDAADIVQTVHDLAHFSLHEDERELALELMRLVDEMEADWAIEYKTKKSNIYREI